MLTVIIPTLNSEQGLAHLLASLVPGAADGVIREVVVADGGSTDGTAVVAEAAGCAFQPSGLPLGARLAASSRAALRGGWFLFIHPAVVLPPGWHGEVAAFIDRQALSHAGAQRAAVFRRARASGGGSAALARAPAALMRRGLPHPEQGLLISRALYWQLGGHAPVADGAEAELYRRIGRRRLATLGATALPTPAGRLGN